ncbi:hypothetical protein ACJX0J_020956, partial [Zea mays]
LFMPKCVFMGRWMISLMQGTEHPSGINIMKMIPICAKEEHQFNGIVPHLIDGGLSILQYADHTVIVSPSTHNSLWRCPTHFHDTSQMGNHLPRCCIAAGMIFPFPKNRYTLKEETQQQILVAGTIFPFPKKIASLDEKEIKGSSTLRSWQPLRYKWLHPRYIIYLSLMHPCLFKYTCMWKHDNSPAALDAIFYFSQEDEILQIEIDQFINDKTRHEIDGDIEPFLEQEFLHLISHLWMHEIVSHRFILCRSIDSYIAKHTYPF